MKYGNQKLKGQSGFSLTETLVVLFIIVVVAALALMQMGSADTQFKRQNVARELKVAFERARFDSVKRHAEGATPGSFFPATVVVDTDTNTYTLNTDSDRNGTYETLVTNLTAQNVTIAPYGSIIALPVITPPITVTFDKRGEVTALDAASVNVTPEFLVCNGTCGTPNAGNANIVLITKTGTVNLLAGNVTPPVFISPGVTSIPPTTGISNMVSLP